MVYKRSVGAAFFSILLLAGWTHSVSAALITVDFEAEFDTATLDLLGAGYGTGNISGSLSYDTATPDLHPSLREGLYKPSPGSFTFSGGGNSGTSSAYITYISDGITDPDPLAVNFTDFRSYTTPVSTQATGAVGWEIRRFRIFLRDPSRTALTSDDLPTALSLNDFEVAEFGLSLFNYNGFTRANALYNITSLNDGSSEQVTVPAPATLFLLGLGITGLGFSIRRRS